MKVKEIMTRDIEKINFNSSLIAAAEKMKSLDIGVLPVEKDGRIIGIVTDRDIIIRGLSMHLDPETTTVSKVMISEVTICYDDDMKDSAIIMEENRSERSEEFCLFCG
jgi:CBS domain-containing protein